MKREKADSSMDKGDIAPNEEHKEYDSIENVEVKATPYNEEPNIQGPS